MSALAASQLPRLPPPCPPLTRHHPRNSPPPPSSSSLKPPLPSEHHRTRRLPIKNPPPRNDDDAVVAWTSSIARHARSGLLSEAAAVFSAMLSAGTEPNDVTLLTLLSSCADFPSFPFALPLGHALHAHVLKHGGAGDVALGTALLDAYAKCGRMDLAREVFDQMPARNSVTYNSIIAGYMRNGNIDRALSLFGCMPRQDRVSWTVLIDGFVKNGLLHDALEHFRGMQANRIEPDYVTVIAIVAACTNLDALGLGLWVHRYVMTQDFRNNVRIGNSLIDMYARCGRVDFARQVFDRMCKRTRITWNSMIVGFAINGCSREALEHFSSMQSAGFEPDGVSFTGALTACSHAGLVEEGVRYYNVMQKEYKILPRVEHYGCMVDLLGRAGRLEDAMHLMEGMPLKPNEVMMGSLLAACRMHGNVRLAERVMGYLIELEPECDSNYVLLSNVYAAIGRWDGVGEMRNRMKALGIKKRPGFSAVEIDCNFHEFVAGDRSHPESDDVYDILDLLCLEMKLYGYDPITTSNCEGSFGA